jgi:hypothetical protein
LLLGLKPFAPAHAANFFISTAADLVLEGLECHAISIQAATGTMQRHHLGKIDISRNVIQSIGGSSATQ